MLDVTYITSILPDLLWATLITIRIAIAAFIVAIFIGLLFSTLMFSQSNFVVKIIFWLTEFIKLTPLLIQIFFVYYVLPEIGIILPAEPTGILVIGLHYACYTCEVFRAGILSVPKGQWEAGHALSLKKLVLWRKIILPQAIRPMIPALGNYLIQLFKEVPLLSTITVYELLNTANLLAEKLLGISRYLQSLV